MSGFRQLSIKVLFLAGLAACVVALVVFVRQFMHWTSTEQWLAEPVGGWISYRFFQFIPAGWTGVQKGVVWFLRLPVTAVLVATGLAFILLSLRLKPRH